MSKLIEYIKRLEELASKSTVVEKEVVIIKEVPIKPNRIMTITSPSRKVIVIYDGQPLLNQCKIVRNFMEVENAREAIRTRIQSQRTRLD